VFAVNKTCPEVAATVTPPFNEVVDVESAVDVSVPVLGLYVNFVLEVFADV